MKKLLFLFAISGGFMLSSCKKDFSCACVQTYTTTAYTQFGVYRPPTTSATTFRNTYEAKKDEGESICNGYESVTINTYGTGEAQYTATTTVTCELD